MSETSSLELKNSEQRPTPTNFKTRQLKNLVYEVRLFIVTLWFKGSNKKRPVSTQMLKQDGLRRVMLTMVSTHFFTFDCYTFGKTYAKTGSSGLWGKGLSVVMSPRATISPQVLFLALAPPWFFRSPLEYVERQKVSVVASGCEHGATCSDCFS